RDRPAEGTLHDLWAKALVLEDKKGEQVLLLTMDLLGLPKGISDRLRDQLEAKFGFSRAQVLLNSSHTHSGPVLTAALSDIYPLDGDQLEKIARYSAQLEEQLAALVAEALRSMKPVRLYAYNGVTRFQVNRRNNNAAALHLLTELKGPNDYAVPVIKVEDAGGKVLAVAFGYACHPTVLDGYQWSGDYAGFAQIELEKMYPGSTALFFQGAGADQNPLPRHSVALAKQYGLTLAAAVNRVLNEEMRPLPPGISTAYTEVDLPLAAPPTEADLSEMAAEFTGYQKRWALRMLDSLKEGKSLRTSYPYPLQAWMLGDQPLLSLGGELVIDYAIELKRVFGPELFVMGYSNDVMAYIPSVRI
ncbi:MAG TPA: neutral/alkaline non-lysosomal ceramidase N-terminal domain-containing protein, partial [Anseongella sp.]|nr:neutral/alkaline non-lysosomal ceramidase N-terminal domain-containing protein [Anseongella sp.]